MARINKSLSATVIIKQMCF